MKACAYCGRKNDLAAVACSGCGTRFPDPETEDSAPERQRTKEVEGGGEPGTEPPDWSMPPSAELGELDMGFEPVEGFSRPNWDAIRTFIQQRVGSEDLFAAWDFAARLWLRQLRKDLGGEARVYRSAHFLSVSDVPPATTQTLLAYAESVLSAIRNHLQTAAWTGYHGRHVLLVFSEQEDYYAYI